MKHAYSLAHLSAIGLPPVDLIQVAARAGYEYVGLRLNRVTGAEPLYPLISSREAMARTQAVLADTGVKVWDVELCRMDPGIEPETYLPLLDATAQLGARHVIAQLPDPDRARAHARFARLCEHAAGFGITVNLEFPWWTQTGNLATAAAVLEATGPAANAGVLVDMLHFFRSRSSLSHLAALPRHWFNYAHVCDGAAVMPVDLNATLYEARSARMAPDEGEFGIKDILAQLPSEMVYVLEIPNDPRCQEIGYEGWAREILQAARRNLDGQAPSALSTPP